MDQNNNRPLRERRRNAVLLDEKDYADLVQTLSKRKNTNTEEKKENRQKRIKLNEPLKSLRKKKKVKRSR